MKRILSLVLVSIILISLSAYSTNVVKGSILQNADDGIAILDVMPQKLFEITEIEIGETVVVTIGDFQKEMTLVDQIIPEEGRLQLFYDSNEHNLSIVAYGQDFCTVYNVPVHSKVKIEKH